MRDAETAAQNATGTSYQIEITSRGFRLPSFNREGSIKKVIMKTLLSES